jgi:hypothetical protein
LVHSWPLRPVGLYVFLPVFVVWGIVRTWRGLRSQSENLRQRAVLLGFCLLQVAFVVSASSAFSSVESSRYRYAVEPFIWAVVAVGLCDLAGWVRERARGLRERAATVPGAAQPRATTRGEEG